MPEKEGEEALGMNQKQDRNEYEKESLSHEKKMQRNEEELDAFNKIWNFIFQTCLLSIPLSASFSHTLERGENCRVNLSSYPS